MTKPWTNVLALSAIGMALGLSALAPGVAHADAVGPYYATPSWDQTLPAATRFMVLTNMNSEVVLDRETGLVWEKNPVSAPQFWPNAVLNCMGANTGGRSGWRMPTFYELSSLVDVVAGGLPAGNPFTVDTSILSRYWSSTSFPGTNTLAMTRGFPTGGFTSFTASPKSNGVNLYWCVRGGVGGNSDPS